VFENKVLGKLKMAVFWYVAVYKFWQKLAEVMDTLAGDMSPKRRSISTSLHGTTTQKTAIFTLAVVRTSDLVCSSKSGAVITYVVGKRTPGRPQCRYGGNTKLILRKFVSLS
jgi:hypothetical protein